VVKSEGKLRSCFNDNLINIKGSQKQFKFNSNKKFISKLNQNLNVNSYIE